MAIAGQSIIVDIIASAALFMDQPFVVGDKIWFKDYEGYVLHIGFKTTKLAGENDEIIVVPNSILSTSIVRSYTYTAFSMKSHMDIDLNTPVELIKTLETNLRQDLASLEAIQQDETVVYFKELKRHAIHLEIRYKVESPTYNCRFLREIQGRVNTRYLTTLQPQLTLTKPLESTKFETTYPFAWHTQKSSKSCPAFTLTKLGKTKEEKKKQKNSRNTTTKKWGRTENANGYPTSSITERMKLIICTCINIL